MTDSCELLEFLESRNPFSDYCSLRSIATGINAGIGVNVDTAKEVGEEILTSMAQQNVLQHSFKKKDQAVTLSTSAVKVNNETIHIDPQLLFQRLIAAGTRSDQLEELCLCFCVFMSRKIILKSSSNQRSGPEQRRVHGAGTSSMCKECWDMPFATILILLLAHAILGCDTTYRVFSMGKGLALKHIRSDKHFITQAEVFL